MSSSETFPFSRKCPYSVPEVYEKLRSANEIAQYDTAPGGRTWILTDYEDVKFALQDARFSNNRQHPNYPSPLPIPPAFRTNGSILGMDAPEHTEYRKLVKSEFTARRVHGMAPKIEDLVDQCLTKFLNQDGAAGEIMEDLALPVTLAVIAELLEIPSQDIDALHRNTREMFDGSISNDGRAAAIKFLDDYFHDFVRAKFEHPGDDMISRIIARDPSRSLTETIHLTRLLFNGGHESTASMIGLGVIVLLEHPEIYRDLATDSELVNSTVEELLRLLSAADLTTPRVAKEDIEVRGQQISAGDGVYPSTAAANRDPAVFSDANQFDPRRANVGKHVAFGFGRHLCLGIDLARAELRVIFRKLAQNAPNLELNCNEGDLSYLDGGFVYRAASVPVKW